MDSVACAGLGVLVGQQGWKKTSPLFCSVYVCVSAPVQSGKRIQMTKALGSNYALWSI